MTRPVVALVVAALACAGCAREIAPTAGAVVIGIAVPAAPAAPPPQRRVDEDPALQARITALLAEEGPFPAEARWLRGLLRQPCGAPAQRLAVQLDLLLMSRDLRVRELFLACGFVAIAAEPAADLVLLAADGARVAGARVDWGDEASFVQAVERLAAAPLAAAAARQDTPLLRRWLAELAADDEAARTVAFHNLRQLYSTHGAALARARASATAPLRARLDDVLRAAVAAFSPGASQAVPIEGVRRAGVDPGSGFGDGFLVHQAEAAVGAVTPLEFVVRR